MEQPAEELRKLMVYKNVRKVSEEGGSYDIQEDPIELEEQN